MQRTGTDDKIRVWLYGLKSGNQKIELFLSIYGNNLQYNINLENELMIYDTVFPCSRVNWAKKKKKEKET